jgi:putative SbcD/Mre11-related phosphoesterase
MSAPAPARPTGAQQIDGVVLDARRAVFFPADRVLAVADLHLGYAWAKRTRGALLPVSAPDDTTTRLLELQKAYRPERLVVLGDVVHEAVALPALEELLHGFCEALSPASGLIFCLGNHDRKLEKLARDWRLPVKCVRQLTLGGHLLLHGDLAPEMADDETFCLESPRLGRRIIGHEHPCIALGDGVATRVKCPAFLVSDDLLVLPAFSSWAAGCEFGRQPFLGPLARAARFHTAYACMGPRLLRVPLEALR